LLEPVEGAEDSVGFSGGVLFHAFVGDAQGGRADCEVLGVAVAVVLEADAVAVELQLSSSTIRPWSGNRTSAV
jgi:hypothetical protein